MEKGVSRFTANALTRQLFPVERAIILGRLAVLERELQKKICLQECVLGKAYLEWWEKLFRKPVIVRLLELNRFLRINVALQFTRI